jgi:hypothetical protein
MSMLSNWLGKKKDTTYTGPKPTTSLTQVKGGQDYYQSLVDRMAGRGVGYGDVYTSTANPIMANLRGQFTGYTLPELKSELSATGRRKGSAGFAQLDKAYRQQGLSENDILAQLVQRNEEQKRAEINAAQAGMGEFARNEANLADNAANFEYGLYGNQVNQADAFRKQQAGAMDKIFQAGGSLMGIPSGGNNLISSLMSRLYPQTATSLNPNQARITNRELNRTLYKNPNYGPIKLKV